MLAFCNINWQVITGVSSVVIALCALILSVWQGIQARRHNILTFKPHLGTSDYSDSSKGIYIVELNNSGLGPAIIKDFIIYVDGERISGDRTEPIEKALKILFPDIPYRFQQTGMGEGHVMAANTKFTILAIQFIGDKIPSKEFVENAFNRGDIEIFYKSFYGEDLHFSTSKDKSGKLFNPENDKAFEISKEGSLDGAKA